MKKKNTIMHFFWAYKVICNIYVHVHVTALCTCMSVRKINFFDLMKKK